MKEDEILELAMLEHLVTGWSLGSEGSLLYPTIEWNSVEGYLFKTCLISYTNEVIRKTKEDILKDVTITSKPNGEVVAVTLADEDHKIYKILWTKEKK